MSDVTQAAVLDLTVTGAADERFKRRRREWTAVAVGTVLGFLLWYPLVWLTPFGGGHWLAASLGGGGRWDARRHADARGFLELAR